MKRRVLRAVVCALLVLGAAPADAAQWPVANPNFTTVPPNDYATYALNTTNAYHTGMDIVGPADPCLYNTPVVAGVAGTVAIVQPIQPCAIPPVGACPGSGCPDQGLGNSVTILGDNGMYYTYGHLDSIDANLEVGQTVAESTPIGILGNSSYGVPRRGSCPGVPSCTFQDFRPHLHFEAKTAAFVGDGYSSLAPDFEGYQDAARELYNVTPITPIVIRVLASPLFLQGVPTTQFSQTASASIDNRFVAYEQAGSWLHIYVPATQALPPELWIPATATGCVTGRCCPNGQCVETDETPPLIVRVISPAAEGGVTARNQPSMSGSRTARLWNGQMFVVVARQLPQAGDTCTGEWFQLQVARPASSSLPVAWACSRTKNEVFLEVREPCDANGQCTTPGVCQSGPGTCTATGCEYPTAVGAACDDGDPCTVNDTCDATTLCAGIPICTPSSTPTPTPTISPTATSTPTPTPTGAAGQVCTTFATGVCCDSADGTNCKAPAVACTSNSACATQAPYTICAGASADNAQAASTTPTTYTSLGFNQCWVGTASVGVSRSFTGGTYGVNNGLLQWDTSALPDTAVVTSATLTVRVSAVDNADARSFQGEWFTWGASCDASDWTVSAANTAFSAPNSSIVVNADNAFALTGLLGNINLSGRTYVRLHESGGQPTGNNRVVFAGYANTSQPGPRLQVCYVLPTPTATSTSSPTATPTPTQTPMATLTPTNTAANPATPALTDTPTVTPTDTSTPTVTNTPTDTSTPSASPTPSDTPTQTPTASTATPTTSASSTPTLTATPTPTPTATATATATLGQVCTTFATGVCCDSTVGTNCKAPAVVCTSNSACAGLAPYTICAGASADNAQAASTTPTTYASLGFNQCWVGTASVGVSRSFTGSTYGVNNGLLQWDTSALPDNAVVTSATLTVRVSAVDNADARSFQGEWFTWGASCDASDWTVSAASTAFSAPNSSIVVNADNAFALTGLLGNINLSGRTYVRLHESGGQPTGNNRVVFAAYANTSQPGPRLQVCYVLPTPTGTSTPTQTATATSTTAQVSTASSTPTETPTSSPTPTATLLPTLTPTLTTTTTPTATATAPPTTTSTSTQTPTATNTTTQVPTASSTPTETPTSSPTLTATAPPTPTLTATAPPTTTSTPTDTPTTLPTVTPTSTNTDTPTATATPSATPAALPTDTPTATVTPTTT